MLKGVPLPFSGKTGSTDNRCQLDSKTKKGIYYTWSKAYLR